MVQDASAGTTRIAATPTRRGFRKDHSRIVHRRRARTEPLIQTCAQERVSPGNRAYSCRRPRSLLVAAIDDGHVGEGRGCRPGCALATSRRRRRMIAERVLGRSGVCRCFRLASARLDGDVVTPVIEADVGAAGRITRRDRGGGRVVGATTALRPTRVRDQRDSTRWSRCVPDTFITRRPNRAAQVPSSSSLAPSPASTEREALRRVEYRGITPDAAKHPRPWSREGE